MIEVKNLVRRFENVTAVDNVSFNISRGEIFGFVGPNGAGKTTTLRILATLDEPTSGEALISGISVVEYPEKARKVMGFVPDELTSMHDMSVREYLDFFGRAYGYKRKDRIAKLGEIEEFTNLTGIRDKIVASLSKGMKQRLCLARALIHDPQVLLMDEPASGLDPRARIELRELLKSLSVMGKTILISSHILTELTEICTGAVIIEKGKLLRTGSISEIISDRKKTEYSLRIRGEQALVIRHLSENPLIYSALSDGPLIRAEFSCDEETAAAEIRKMIVSGFEILEFYRRKTDLEDLFMSITTGEVQ